MQKRTFDLDAISTRLQGCDEFKRLAFGIFLLERALPEFLQFQIDSESAGGGELRAVLAQCWSVLETGGSGGACFVTLDACEKILPDSEEHSSPYASAAIDAVNIACNMLEFLETRNARLLVESVIARRDTVDLFIQNNTDVGPADKGLDERIESHVLMQNELRLLSEDLDLLQACMDARHAVFSVAIERVTQRDYRSLRLKP